ncbi:TolC family protein [Elusimicrobiota bacterium]
MMNKLGFSIFLLLYSSNLIFAETEKNNNEIRILAIEEFIETAVEKDAVLEEILIEELALKYQKHLKLPAGDLLLSVKSQYEFFLSQERSDPRAAISLSKLFPYSGTDISAEYMASPLVASDGNNSEISFLISQPIAKNAFGKATKLHDKIIGLETDIAEHQIIEAYEDYLANITVLYYNWYSAYEDLNIGESSYQQSLKLLENIEQRKKNNIALPVDVNKIKVQTLTKKENLIELQEKHESIFNRIKQTIRYEGKDRLQPVDPVMHNSMEISFDVEYDKFRKESRTYRMLGLLEEKSLLQVKKNADDLLPSTNLLLGYQIEGEDFTVKDGDDLLYAGLSVIWPFPGQRENAAYETAEITDRKVRLSNNNKYIQLRTDLKNLFIKIEREKKLISIAEEKIALAESILEDETKNYTYGKVSLNDFIDAVNRVDENRFRKILHSVQMKVLVTEWLRITDRLISRKDIKKTPQKITD